MTASDKAPKGRAKDWWVVEVEGASPGLFRYRRLWGLSFVATCLVSLAPLVIMFVINYLQYEKAFFKEVRAPIRLTTADTSRALEFYLEERLAALNYVVHDQSFERLIDQRNLARTFENLKTHFSGFVDIGLIDSAGVQRSYVGPYGLTGKTYAEQAWFRETLLKESYVSDVFMGYRQFPHFALAVTDRLEDGTPYVLRATMNAAALVTPKQQPSADRALDEFVINRQGVLQTPSDGFGSVLGEIPFPVPPPADTVTVLDEEDADGGSLVVGYKYIDRSPFIYVVAQHQDRLLASWFSLRNELTWFLVLSAVLIIVVVFFGTSYMVKRVREADAKRASVLHEMEYTAKMASIGRLAAGVAHEINNPLAVINEKAGLLEDFVTFSEGFPYQEKFLKHISSIGASVERCARITRRLLRFAKHLDIRRETIDLEALIREVLGFLEKESNYRGIEIELSVDPDVPVIESDPGRLQQVFLNIINNAFGAVEDGGRIDIRVAQERPRFVSVRIRDNGHGISPENLDNIFEPFFTTKDKHGTGLGLSITYGIVTKLGGKVTVDSVPGEWTEFRVELPVTPEPQGEER